MDARIVPAALASVLALAALIGGCSDPCGDLQLICNRCNDPNHKDTCERLVDSGTHATCTEGIDNFNNVCK